MHLHRRPPESTRPLFLLFRRESSDFHRPQNLPFTSAGHRFTSLSTSLLHLRTTVSDKKREESLIDQCWRLSVDGLCPWHSPSTSPLAALLLLPCLAERSIFQRTAYIFRLHLQSTGSTLLPSTISNIQFLQFIPIELGAHDRIKRTLCGVGCFISLRAAVQEGATCCGRPPLDSLFDSTASTCDQATTQHFSRLVSFISDLSKPKDNRSHQVVV